MRRILVCAAGVAALLTTLTGCYGLQSETLNQKDTIGAVHVTTTMCSLDLEALFPPPPPPPPLPPPVRGAQAQLQPAEGSSVQCGDSTSLLIGLSLADAFQQWPLQPVVAYRVPDGTQVPATLTATDGLVEVPLVRSDDVAATLPAASGHDTPAGTHWVGYRGDGGTLVQDVTSPEFQFPDINATEAWTIEADFGLPSAARPFRGPFGHDAVVGWRLAADQDHINPDFFPSPGCGLKARRSVGRSAPRVCVGLRSDVRRAVTRVAAAAGVPALAGRGANGITEPDPDIFALNRALSCDETVGDLTGGEPLDLGPGPIPSFVPTAFCGLQTEDAQVQTSVATRDLGIGVPAAVPTVQQGSTGTVTFPVRFAGATGPSFALSAATTVPGGSAAPAQAVLTPATDATTDQAVSVTVPAGATLGTYDVTLTATVGGQVRTATGHVTLVEAPAPPAPPAPPVPDVKFTLPTDTSVDDHTVDIGSATCTKPSGTCEAPVYLMTRNGQLHASSAAAAKVRLIVLARTRVRMKAGKTVKLILRVGPKVRRTLQRNRSIRGRVSTRQKWAGVPSSQRLWLRPHKKHKHS